MSEKDCIFCKIANGELKSEKVLESDSFFAIRDISPKTEGHTLVIPKKHFVTLLDIPNRLGGELLEFTKKVVGKLMDEKFADGFNIEMNNLEVAGQEVMHAHFHVLPRKEGDGLKVGWVTSTD
jgi:histidine triad (HIT) family protein